MEVALFSEETLTKTPPSLFRGMMEVIEKPDSVRSGRRFLDTCWSRGVVVRKRLRR